VKRVVDPALYSDWTSHQWILQNTTLAEVTTRLEETFGLTVVYESPEIAQERMSGIVSTENLEDLLDALSTINGLRMTKTKNQLRIAR
jgi:ferric-dicitrate binding protein FerR (iron transport regulator)